MVSLSCVWKNRRIHCPSLFFFGGVGGGERNVKTASRPLLITALSPLRRQETPPSSLLPSPWGCCRLRLRTRTKWKIRHARRDVFLSFPFSAGAQPLLSPSFPTFLSDCGQKTALILLDFPSFDIKAWEMSSPPPPDEIQGC